MLSSKQYEEKRSNVAKIVKEYLSNDITISEAARIVGISSSTAQRYLNDFEYYKLCFGSEAEKFYKAVQIKLFNNLATAKSKGGINYSQNNVALKDENGHFKGSRRK